ncbi:uncharacterized protein [Euphorbia lathyris]|uniref:uncharacterized protein n=1 Tax=Euphorbia lathyris TaxID=212925 RepID=UPI00331347C0
MMNEEAYKEMRKEMEELKEQVAKLAGLADLKDQMTQLMDIVKGKSATETQKTPESHGAGTSSSSHGKKKDTIFIEIPRNEEVHQETPVVPDLDDVKIRDELRKFVTERSLLEERLKAIEGVNGTIDAMTLCLVSDIVIPYKFKSPEFEKFRGASCPQTHMTMYCNKMTAYASNDKLLMHIFQESHKGPALRWYTQLDRAHIRKWKDLADAFMKQYKHNMDMAPNREDLRTMEKKDSETFKEYAQKWRDKAAEVIPPLSDKEMISSFLDTLKPPFYNMMLANTTGSFSDFAVAGERIEQAIRKGKLESSSPDKNAFRKGIVGKKKDEETHMIHGYPSTEYSNFSQGPSAFAPNIPQNGFVAHAAGGSQQRNWNNTSNQGNNFSQNTMTRRPQEPIDPIPITYAELLPQLLQSRQVSISPIEPMAPPYPKWYDANAKCEYDAGVSGHNIENCTAFKRKVQQLVKAGWLKFNQRDQKPDVNKNPLPNHDAKVVNAVTNDDCCLVKTKVEEIMMPMEHLYHIMCKIGLLEEHPEGRTTCSYHAEKVEHLIAECDQFKQKVQECMDARMLIFEASNQRVAGVNVVQREESSLPIPIVINYDRSTSHVENLADISGTTGMTRSGRCFTSEEVEKRRRESTERRRKGKAKEGDTIEDSLEKEFDTSDKSPTKEIVTEDEACEFLKLVKQSEYRVIEQLNQIPARISLLSLIMSSTSHIAALLKILDQAYVCHDISVENLNNIVGNVVASNYLTFTDDEIPMEGTGHTKALHISVKCKDHAVARVLIDNGSSLNIMPRSTLARLPVDSSYIKPSNVLVRAFDGTKREVIGDVELPIQIGPVTFNIAFQVMDITPAYSLLLGRPWIHSAGAIPSSLHQKIKFIVNGKLVEVSGEDDILISKCLSTPYIDVAEESIESSFQTFEVAMAREMIRSHYQAQRGLGKNNQGMADCLEPLANYFRVGLGYHATRHERWKIQQQKREARLARLENREVNEDKREFPPISSAFISKGRFSLNDGTMVISVIGKDEGDPGPSDWVSVCEGELQNWKTYDLPVKESSDEVFDNHDNYEPICNFDNSVYEIDSEGEIEEEIPTEIERMLEVEKKTMEPQDEALEVVNLGTEKEPREVKINGTLDQDIKERLASLLKEYKDVFAWSYEDMPGLNTDIVVHKLPLKPESKPVKQKLRKMKPKTLLKIKEEVKKQFDAGFLAVSNYSEWVANVVPVPKKDGKVRMCVDYRDLNRASPKDNFPLPHIDVLVDNTAGYHMLSLMDGFLGYSQILMDMLDREKMTFVTLWGTFCYKVMPFGLKNAGATYQRAMVTIFHDMMHKEMEVYVDDMVAKSRANEDHMVVLRKVFERLRKFQIRLNPSKCVFGITSGNLLGFIVSRRGIEVDPDKIKAILEMPPPKSEKEVRGFLGKLNYIARFIAQLTSTCEPIFKLLRKCNPCKWNPDCQKALDKIKEYLQNPPILQPVNPDKPLLLYLTVHDNSMGALLGQHDETKKKEHAIYYVSKKFTDCESRYSPLEKTCAALAWASQRLRHYMLNNTTCLISRMDPVKFIFEKPALTGRLARWQVLLSEYDIVYVTQKAIKGSVIANFLADYPVEHDHPMEVSFPDEDIVAVEVDENPPNVWTMRFDGASNAIGHGIGVVLVSPEGQHFPITARLCFQNTNNTAEYEACALGVRAALEMGIKNLKVYGDSALVINQLNGEWETRDSKLIPYQEHIQEMIKSFHFIKFEHVSRLENQMADALANLASTFELEKCQKLPAIEIKLHEDQAYCGNIEQKADGKPWYHDIKNYIQEQIYPQGATSNDKRAIRLATSFFLSGDILYKRNHDTTLIRCVCYPYNQKLVEEVHEGFCRTHLGGHTLARKILRMGYYWIKMESDCIKYVRKCHKCQIYADDMNAPSEQLHVMVAPWPFSMWGLDVIGPIEPKASNGHRFILVAIDYFTKWVEAASYASVTKTVVTKFMKNNIVCRYGLPERIITDNEKNFNNKTMEEMCMHFKIKHHNSTPYRPKMNGAVEAANKNIKKIVQKMALTYKDWHEMLPFALHGYRTTARTSTGPTPFSLVYGMEAVLPIEVEILSLRIMMEAGIEDSEWAQKRYDQLNFIEEKRLTAICHGQLYQRRLIKSYGKKVRPRQFREGELVLKKIILKSLDPRGKWTPKYEGPYMVKREFTGGALTLTNMDGNELPNPVNSDSVKKYFA